MTAWYDIRAGKPRHWKPSLLNLKVDALHALCIEDLGGCMAGPTIMAYGYVFAPCVRCAVPVRARGWAWRDNSTMFERGAA